MHGPDATGTTPVRIAFLSGPLGRGGAEQQLYYLLSGLDRARWSPLVIHTSRRQDEHWVEPIRDLGVDVLHVDSSRGRLGRIQQTARVLKEHRAGIVHSTLLYLNPYAAVASRLAGTRLCIGGICEDASGRPQLRSMLWMGYHGCDVLMSNFAAAMRNVPDRVKSRTLQRVVYSGIPISEMVNGAERARVRASFGCSGEGPVIGAVGRLDRNKNFTLLIDAFARVAPKWPASRLVIAGDGPMRAELESYAAGLGLSGRVRFPGRVPGSAETAIFPAFDVACLSSISEGFPIALLEASMAGVPVVSTVCGGTPEMIADGETGYLTGQGDVGAMSAAIARLLADPERARAMGRAGRERVTREFSVARMISSTEAVYEEALGMRVSA